MPLPLPRSLTLIGHGWTSRVEVSGLGNNWCRCRMLPSDRLIETSEERERGGMAYLSYLDSGNSDAEVMISQSAAVACCSLVTCVLSSGVERVRMVEQLDIKTQHSRDLAGSSSVIGKRHYPDPVSSLEVLAKSNRYCHYRYCTGLVLSSKACRIQTLDATGAQCKVDYYTCERKPRKRDVSRRLSHCLHDADLKASSRRTLYQPIYLISNENDIAHNDSPL